LLDPAPAKLLVSGLVIPMAVDGLLMPNEGLYTALPDAEPSVLVSDLT